MHKFCAMNNNIPNCHSKGNAAKKPTYSKSPDGMIINKQTGNAIGTYTHAGAPRERERACKIRGELVAYLPLAEGGA